MRYFPLEKVNNGPVLDVVVDRYFLRARKGQREEPFAAIQMTTPCRNGSVFDDLIRTDVVSFMKEISWCMRVESGSNLVLCDEVYSDTLRKPKNPMSMAAHNMSLSS